MIPPEQRDFVGPLRLECEEASEGLQAVVTPVHEVTHEDVVRVGNLPARSEQLLQVVKLSVEIYFKMESEAKIVRRIKETI